jgi:hypothetical protein
VVTVGGGDGDEGKPWVAVGDSGGGMCVLDARMGLVLYRWKVNSESGVSHAETVPGMPHMLLTAAERTLTGNFFTHLPLQSWPPVLEMALTTTTTTRHDTRTVWDLSGNAPVALRSFQPHGAEAITALAPHPPYFGLSTAGHRVAATPLPPYDSSADEAQVRSHPSSTVQSALSMERLVALTYSISSHVYDDGLALVCSRSVGRVLCRVACDGE